MSADDRPLPGAFLDENTPLPLITHPGMTAAEADAVVAREQCERYRLELATANAAIVELRAVNKRLRTERDTFAAKLRAIEVRYGR